jgi:RNA polymerase sigma factor (sigma-70 family)
MQFSSTRVLKEREKRERDLVSENVFSMEAQRSVRLTEEEMLKYVTMRDEAKAKGDEETRIAAVDALVNGNLRLVLKLISTDFKQCGLSFADLVSCGSVALFKTMERFHPDKGRLSPYLKWWMRHEISSELSKFHSVHIMPIGSNKAAKVAKLATFLERFPWEHNRQPTDEEIAEHCKIRISCVAAYVELTQRRRVSLEHVDVAASEVSQPVEANSLKLAREAFIEALDEREQIIVRHRYGIDGYPKLMLRELSEMLGMTQERVRQIQVQAVKKMRQRYEKSERGKKST